MIIGAYHWHHEPIDLSLESLFSFDSELPITLAALCSQQEASSLVSICRDVKLLIDGLALVITSFYVRCGHLSSTIDFDMVGGMSPSVDKREGGGYETRMPLTREDGGGLVESLYLNLERTKI